MRLAGVTARHRRRPAAARPRRRPRCWPRSPARRPSRRARCSVSGRCTGAARRTRCPARKPQLPGRDRPAARSPRRRRWSDDGTVLFGSHDGQLYAVGRDGMMRWSYATSDIIFSSPAVAHDGTTYIGSDDDHLYAMRRRQKPRAGPSRSAHARRTSAWGPTPAAATSTPAPRSGPTASSIRAATASTPSTPTARCAGGSPRGPRRVGARRAAGRDGGRGVAGRPRLRDRSRRREALGLSHRRRRRVAAPPWATTARSTSAPTIARCTRSGPTAAALGVHHRGRRPRLAALSATAWSGRRVRRAACTPIHLDGTLAWTFRSGDRIVSSALVDATGAVLVRLAGRPPRTRSSPTATSAGRSSSAATSTARRPRPPTAPSTSGRTTRNSTRCARPRARRRTRRAARF